MQAGRAEGLLAFLAFFSTSPSPTRGYFFFLTVRREKDGTAMCGRRGAGRSRCRIAHRSRWGPARQREVGSKEPPSAQRARMQQARGHGILRLRTGRTAVHVKARRPSHVLRPPAHPTCTAGAAKGQKERGPTGGGNNMMVIMVAPGCPLDSQQ
ncbi:hypothetical protein B0J12DRAFT_686321 [Macrophomina phaseolina]|uniref:Secreted protein n=1 Tax=Macrophomina phaseolina TaxID=35725 RepID=A0ABQ8FW00_9PEZI|nr:hypothetical protein B0J12DRAFT_686321 [Macrophomina phaseolina]